MVQREKESIDYFRKLAGLEGAPQVTQFPNRDPATEHRGAFVMVRTKSRVALYTIKGGGHGAPHPATYGPRLPGNSNRDIHALLALSCMRQPLPGCLYTPVYSPWQSPLKRVN
jgi:poly(3-hydroxybutyrate) depolymerase